MTASPAPLGYKYFLWGCGNVAVLFQVLRRFALGVLALEMAWSGAACPAPLRAADRLILRNLEILNDRTVTSLDEDGLVLDQPRPGGTNRITWDEVERGRVALDQSRFDRHLRELGLPLFRIRQRLKAADFRAIGPVAEELYPRFAERKSQTAYLVCQATMWSRLAAGQRESAVEPFLRCYELLRSRAAESSALPGSRRLKVDEASALSSELAPIWLDAQAAAAALGGVQAAIRTMANPRPVGAYLYYASLAVAAGQMDEAERMIPLLEHPEGAARGCQELIRAQQELATGAGQRGVDQLRGQLSELPEPCRIAAHYVLGLSDLRSTNDVKRREGLLSLLAIPAAYGQSQPELAAAALYQAAAGLDKLKDRSGAAAVRAELAGRYTGTHFEQQVRGKAGH